VYYHSFDELQGSKQSIVVDNRAHQQALSSAINWRRKSSGALAWRAPDIVTVDNVIDYSFALHSLDSKSELRDCFLLSKEQERAVWAGVVSRDGSEHLRAPEIIAQLLQHAWQLKNVWQIRNSDETARRPPDVDAFLRWSEDFARALKKIGAIDRATFFSKHMSKHPDFTAQGFRRPSPTLRSWLNQDKFLCTADERLDTSNFVPHVYDSFEDELHEAMFWAKRVWERDRDSRVVVGIDSLSSHMDEVHRCGADVFGQIWDSPEMPYFSKYRDILGGYPAIRIAFLVLGIRSRCKWDTVSELIRHPLLKGFDEERHQRSVFDARLRDENRYELDLPLIINRLEQSGDCLYLLEFFRSVEAALLTSPRVSSLSYWISHFNKILRAVGVIGLRDKTSSRNSLEVHWSRVCDQVTSLDAVMEFVTRGEALSILKRHVEQTTVFAGEKSTGIFIMPADDAFIVDPTHLWVAHASSKSFVSERAGTPFLPIASQRLIGIPGLNPASDKMHVESIISMLTALGRERHVSYSKFEGDERVSFSPFFPRLADVESEKIQRFTVSDWNQPAAKLQEYSDFIGPALDSTQPLVGGVSVFYDQAVCPFKAFAVHRLSAIPVFEPIRGINYREKGVIVHQVMNAFWRGLKTSSTLQKFSSEEKLEYVKQIVHGELKKDRFATSIETELFKIEIDRLIELIQAWTDFELTLESFRVLSQEEKVSVNIFGVPVKIKPDRIDQLESGDIRIVDYKTGVCSRSDWVGPRLSAPQLPIYTIFHPLFSATSIAFAHVNILKPRWIEVPASDSPAEDWNDWTNHWEQDIKILAEEIVSGIATPEIGEGDVCAYCDQGASSLIEVATDDLESKAIL